MPIRHERPIYPAEVQAQLDEVEAEFQIQKNNLQNEHKLRAAAVRDEKDSYSVGDLRLYEKLVFDPYIISKAKERQDDKKTVIKEM